MALGPGKYDHICTQARESGKATGAVLILFDGEHGSGFSVQLTAEMTAALPRILRKLADDVEPDILPMWREH